MTASLPLSGGVGDPVGWSVLLRVFVGSAAGTRAPKTQAILLLSVISTTRSVNRDAASCAAGTQRSRNSETCSSTAEAVTSSGCGGVAAARGRVPRCRQAVHPRRRGQPHQPIAASAPIATAMIRPRFEVVASRPQTVLPSRAAAHAQPMCSRSSKKPIAAAVAPAAPSRTPYPSVGFGAAAGA